MTRRRNRSQYDVRTYLGPDVYERVLREAAVRRMSLSQCIRQALAEHYAIQDELAGALRVDAGEKPAGRRITHALLAEMEARIAAGIGGQASEIARLREALRRLECMLDRHYLGMMLHLPEIPKELWDERSASASRRQRAWLREVEAALSEPDGQPTGKPAEHLDGVPAAPRQQRNDSD